MSKYLLFKELEREIARKMKALGFLSKRLWGEQFEEGGKIDVRAGKYVFQCKYGKRPNMRKAWVEANTAKKMDEVPVGVARFKEERSTFVILSWKDFEDLLKKEEKWVNF